MDDTTQIVAALTALYVAVRDLYFARDIIKKWRARK